MAVLIFAAVLFLYTTYRFYWRYGAERRRQEIITWPTAPGRLQLEDISLKRDETSGSRYLSRIEGGYQLYAQGNKYTGNRLLPDAIVIDEDERYDIEQWLEGDEEMPVRFNPGDPSDNTILVGHDGLSWSRIYVYLLFGILLPAFLIWVYLNFLLFN